MKSALFLSLLGLFMAAAAKPFLHDHPPQTPSSWAAFRSYPHAVRADAAAAQKIWSASAYHYSQALVRNPHDARYTRGILMAWQQILAQMPRLRAKNKSQAAPVLAQLLTQALPPQPQKQNLYKVRYDIPQEAHARVQQTAWRGPIVPLTAKIVPLHQTMASDAHVVAAPETPAHVSLAATSKPMPTLAMAPQPPQPVSAAQAAQQAPRLSVTSSATWRARSAPSIVPGMAELGGSQTGAEIRWRLNNSASQPLQLAAATYVGTRDGFSLNHQTMQAVVGVRYKPLPHINAVIGADRLIKLGAQSRSSFALRLMADAGRNYEAPPEQNRWLHWHAGLDSALIGARRRDIFASGEARIGMGFRVTEQISLTPYLGANALLQKADNVQTRVDAGPGLWLRARISDQTRLDMRLAYRMTVAGNVASQDGLVAQLSISF